MKSWLLVKPEFVTEAEKLFNANDINFTTVGRIHLGAAIGSENFCQTFQQNKVTEWKEQVTKLAKIAQTQPHSAYSALVHGLKGRWTFATRTNEFHSDCLSPLESSIREQLIPALSARPVPGDTERKLLSLPPRLGGLGMINLMSLTSVYATSKKITEPLTTLILQQQTDLFDTCSQQTSLK